MIRRRVPMRLASYGGTSLVRGGQAGAAVRYDQNAAAAAGSDELVQISVALPFSPWMTWTMLS
jgi:hypothetical protein